MTDRIGKPTKIEVVGIVLAVEWEDPPDFDPFNGAQPLAAEQAFEHFAAQGYDVQAVTQHIDGMLRIEVLSG